jgi:hypothetical protein
MSSSTSTTPAADHDGLFHHPLVFESQHDLYQWLNESKEIDAQQVDAISFSLALDNTQSPVVEKAALFKYMGLLPNLRSLSVYKLSADRYNSSYNQLYDDFLKQVSKLWPKLEVIAAHTDDHHLNFLRGLQHLRKLQFTGYSTASPMETATVLTGLRYLTDIELFPALGPTIPPQRTVIPETNTPQSAFLTSQTDSSSSSSFAETPPALFPNRYPSRTTTRLSLNREVLRNLRGLRSFTIRENLDSTSKSSAFFTEPFLLALASATSRGNLMSFSVELKSVPTKETETRFKEWVSRSRIRHLDVQWGLGHTEEGEGGVEDTGSVVVNALPSSVVTVKWNGLGSGQSLKRLSEKKANGELKELTEVTVVVTEAEREVSDRR